MPIRRTTLAAERDDLAALEAEARRREISLAQLLRELVAKEAGRLRRQRWPRFGIARSRMGASAAASEDEHAPVRERRQS
ncbi:MAG: hypothetical protein ACRDIF_03265 [Actinomycetota bacterium]